MCNKEIYNVGNYVIELTLPDRSRDLSHSSCNNISSYDKKGKLLWNISELLKAYSDKNALKYYDEMYFEIRLLEDDKIFCVGFINHCEIDLKNGIITKIVNNR